MKKSGLVWLIAALGVVALLSQAAHAANVRVDSANYFPTPAKPGQSFDLWVHVKNNSGSSAENVVFRLGLSDKENNRTNYPFSLGSDDSPQRSLGTIIANQSALVKFRVFVDKAALNGNYTITAEVGDNSMYGSLTRIAISVLAQNPQLEIVESQAIELSPGQPKELELVLKNTGNAKAVNVLVGTVEDRTVTTTGVVVERQISILGITQTYLDSIEVGSTASAKLTLVASGNTESKAYTIPIKLTWEDENRSAYSATRYIGVEVNVVPDLDVALSSSKPEPVQGEKTELGFDIYNAGPAAAKNIVVEISSSAAESISGQKIFIGTLESDDSTTFKSTFKLKKGLAAGTYPVEVKISYKDPRFRESASTKTLNITVLGSKPQSGDGMGIIIPIIIVVAIIAGAVLFLHKKGKQRKK